ncbi:MULTISPECIES: ferredoxin [unclassified Microbacterium]|uniref:ferredoxin n=1 Tax=unclassified Microbacterium TaxID=2609290 RepID=UPI000EA8E548|nr:MULTISPECIES: ferredoxin [unclassified Microbacterium]MBT2486738.1 ferredoxin [Microbacterium sp. ISL-108]RKN64671.1 ferredoxin [Microbacterium sp. CGR2]
MPTLNPDTTGCIGAGICTNTAPTVFDLDDNGLVRLRTIEVDPADVEATDAAIAICPAQALAWAQS